jgi:hypothetical protein
MVLRFVPALMTKHLSALKAICHAKLLWHSQQHTAMDLLIPTWPQTTCTFRRGQLIYSHSWLRGAPRYSSRSIAVCCCECHSSLACLTVFCAALYQRPSRNPVELYQFVCYLLPFWWCHQGSLTTGHKATGPDNIQARYLKELALELTPTITFLFQTSLEEGKLPNDWLQAHIVPVFKKGAFSISTISFASLCRYPLLSLNGDIPDASCFLLLIYCTIVYCCLLALDWWCRINTCYVPVWWFFEIVILVTCKTSLEEGKLPNDWLQAHIVPVFKKGDKKHCIQLSTGVINIYTMLRLRMP